MTCVCPTCGAPALDVPLLDMLAVCTWTEARILRFVAENDCPSIDDIVAHVYAGKDLDAMDDPYLVICVLACKIRKKIARFGWTLLGTPRLGRWRLERVAA